MKPVALTPHAIRKAKKHLAAADPVMAGIIKQVGHCHFGRSQREDPFTALIEAIVWQQLSGKAAATIYGRLLKVFPGQRPTPAAILKASEDAMRAAGLSRGKISYLRDLATKVKDGTVALDDLDHLSDDEIVTSMTRVKGIGRWSAEMFLMFRLQRLDVLPVGDLAIVKAIQRNYRLRKTPTADRMYRLAEAWRPYRSVASWYLWASGDVVPGADGA